MYAPSLHALEQEDGGEGGVRGTLQEHPVPEESLSRGQATTPWGLPVRRAEAVRPYQHWLTYV